MNIVDKAKGTVTINDITIPLNDRITNFIEVGDILIAVTSPNRERSWIDNVYGVDTKKREILWRIKNPRRDVHILNIISGSSYIASDCHFIDAKLINEKEVWLYSLCNFAAIIDELTGDIKEVRQLHDFK